MKAIFRHELQLYYNSMTGYLIAVFLLLFTGLGALIYNINSSIANFEYVLSFISIVFIIIVPLLTMRTFAEEKKQKTDQLLYSLPIKMSDIVLGKFLALAVVFVIPMAVIAFYPLFFSKFGDVYLPTSYGSLLAFLLLGLSLIAIGMFISSITERQSLSAGLTCAFILLNYFSAQLADYLPEGTVSTFIKNLIIKLSLFEHLAGFVNGVFSIGSIVFYLSVTFFFLFLSYESMEKRRYVG